MLQGLMTQLLKKREMPQMPRWKFCP